MQEAYVRGTLPISIHALREESDAYAMETPGEYTISIHALREESDGNPLKSAVGLCEISIHALREESDSTPMRKTSSQNLFQSTLSVRRATRYESAIRMLNDLFQSTLSVRRATDATDDVTAEVMISIHALREESDGIPLDAIRISSRFQSTLSVRRATQLERADRAVNGVFQSTLSVRRATRLER